MSERGQAFTLEAITASLLLIGGLVFALQATAVTPLSASTSSQHIENQQQAVAEGVLTTALEDGSLRRAVLFWDSSNSKFYGASERYYVDDTPNNEFGDALDRAFGSRDIVANVYVYYQEGNRRTRQWMIYRGEPSDNAVSASVALTLADDDVVHDSNGDPTGPRLDSTPDFYASNANTGGVYNVVEVEVVVWRQ
jgi:hypothetical protein